MVVIGEGVGGVSGELVLVEPGLPWGEGGGGDGEGVELEIAGGFCLIEKGDVAGGGGEGVGVGFDGVVFVRNGADGGEGFAVGGLLDEEGAFGGGSARWVTSEGVGELGGRAIEGDDDLIVGAIELG